MTLTALGYSGSESELPNRGCNRQEIENEFNLRRTWIKPDEIGWLQVCYLVVIRICPLRILGCILDLFPISPVNLSCFID